MAVLLQERQEPQVGVDLSASSLVLIHFPHGVGEGLVEDVLPRVLVVLTDGRSQDDVNKVSKEMQMEGGFQTMIV